MSSPKLRRRHSAPVNSQRQLLVAAPITAFHFLFGRSTQSDSCLEDHQNHTAIYTMQTVQREKRKSLVP